MTPVMVVWTGADRDDRRRFGIAFGDVTAGTTTATKISTESRDVAAIAIATVISAAIGVAGKAS